VVVGPFGLSCASGSDRNYQKQHTITRLAGTDACLGRITKNVGAGLAGTYVVLPLVAVGDGPTAQFTGTDIAVKSCPISRVGTSPTDRPHCAHHFSDMTTSPPGATKPVPIANSANAI